MHHPQHCSRYELNRVCWFVLFSMAAEFRSIPGNRWSEPGGESQADGEYNQDRKWLYGVFQMNYRLSERRNGSSIQLQPLYFSQVYFCPCEKYIADNITGFSWEHEAHPPSDRWVWLDMWSVMLKVIGWWIRWSFSWIRLALMIAGGHLQSNSTL